MFDRQTQDMLDGRTRYFWIDDPTRTDLMAYPPGFTWWLASIYSVTGDRGPASVQTVTVILDSLSVLLLLGIGASAFGWRVGLTAAALAALSPLLAFSGGTPNSDAPTSWFVLGSVWCILLAIKRSSVRFALAAGLLLGLGCWLRVNPLFLAFGFSAAMFFLVSGPIRDRLILSSAVSLATLLIISPIVFRNLVVFYPEFAPTGLHVGWNMLAGIGETERGQQEFGAPCCDAGIIEQDRAAMNLPADAPLALAYPDGIRRDRERGRRAVAIIAQHPVWYAGVVMNRLWGHFKFGGEPVPNVGTMGINVTQAKTLPPLLQNGVLGICADVIADLQSVWRVMALPMMVAGLFIGFKIDKVSTCLFVSVILYYLVTLGIGHSEIRYGLPMQGLLIIFAGVAVAAFSTLGISRIRDRFGSRKNESHVA